MNTKTDRASSDDPAASGKTASSSPGANSHDTPQPVPPPLNPHFALFVSTVGGIGYFPKAPGTWGSLVGILLSVAVNWIAARPNIAAVSLERNINFWTEKDVIPGGLAILASVIVAGLGVWASDRVAKRFREKDPQYVVVDEVSGQQLTYLLAFVGGNWKYLLLGFILFRVFDIWKPFPARQAESLPGGWGIMADDWIAGIYAAIGLWLARAAGL
ncbi:MAG: phosphatidylglycerophosphatase A [Candidatus Acidiferrales bacterium]